MEDHIAAEAFEDEYTQVMKYDNRAHCIIGLLQARIAAAQVLLPTPQNATTALEPARSICRHTGMTWVEIAKATAGDVEW